jgi:uncharacterized protein YbaR (Trm112 family)
MKENNHTYSKLCSFCKKGQLEFIKGTEPWDYDHLMCNNCNSTYNLDEFIKE